MSGVLPAFGRGERFAVPLFAYKKPGTLHSGPGKIHNYKTKDNHYEHSTNKGRITAAPVPVLPLVSKPFTICYDAGRKLVISGGDAKKICRKM